MALVIGGIGIGLAVTSAALLGSGDWRRPALTGPLIGSTVLAVALLAPLYHTCGASTVRFANFESCAIVRNIGSFATN
jgi:hypothetical protein